MDFAARLLPCAALAQETPMRTRKPSAINWHTVEALESRRLLSTYYVSPSGNDAALGTSDAVAWKTLQKAGDTAASGDTVVIRAGTYTVGMNLFGKAGGTAAAPVRFLADP